MQDLIEKELIVHRIQPINRYVCVCDGEKISIKECIRNYTEQAQSNKKVILGLWYELCDLLSEEQEGSPCEELSLAFTNAVQGLYSLSCCFEFLKKTNVTNCLKNVLNSDIKNFSGRTMGKVIEFKLAISWLHHIIRKNMYIRALLLKYREVTKTKRVEARGISGPWANLDLPMLERTFPWDDVAEETAGREKDKMHQRRYEMGLENYGDGDHTPNEGFYWREIRNEPYSFDDEDETLYPHRNTLWV